MPDQNDNPFIPRPSAGYYNTLASALLRKFPSQGQAYLRVPTGMAGISPIPGGAPVWSALQEAIFGKTLPFGVPEAVGTPTRQQAQHPIDVTDPSVDPGDLELSGDEKIMRRLRRLGRQVHGTLFRGVLTSAGERQNEALGDILPARDGADRVIDLLAPMLAAAGVFGAAGAVGETLGAVAPSAFGGASALGTAVEPVLGKALPTPVAAGVARLTGGALTEQAVRAGAGGLLEDLAIGGAYGAGEVATAQATGDLTPEQADQLRTKTIITSALAGMGISAGLRAVFHPLTSLEVLRGVTNRLRGIEAGVPTPAPVGVEIGDVIAGHTATVDRGNGKFSWRNDKGFSKGPTPEELKQFYFAKAQRASAGGGAATPPEIANAELQKVTPDDPGTLPADLQSKISDVGIIASNYYIDQVPTLLRKYSAQQLEGELLGLKQILIDPSVPIQERVTATGRVIALEHALKQSHGTPTGLLPFDMEVAATQMVRDVKPTFGAEGVLKQAANIAVEGQPELAGRIEQLARMGDWPEKYHEEVRKRLAKFSKVQSRGFKTGDVALWNGRIVRLLEDPRYGVVHAAPMGKGDGSPQLADVIELTAIPKAGEFVRLRNGRVLKVRAMRPETFEFQSERWYSISDIDRVASSKADLLGEVRRQSDAVLRDEPGSQQDIPPVAAATTAGENVTVLSVGQKEATVRTKTGRVKVVPRETVVQAATSPTEVGHITTMVPGTIPQSGNRVVFVSVKRAALSAFEDAVAAGKIDGDMLLHAKGNLAYAHVLPPHTYSDAAAVYGVEIPASMLPKDAYSQAANKAVEALGGRTLLDTYSSPIDVPVETLNNEAKFFRIPDELHSSTQWPEDVLALEKDQNIQTAYLRHLIAFNETMDSEIMRPMHQAALALTETADAVTAGDGVAALESSQQASAALNTSLSNTADASIKDQGNTLAEVLAEPEPEIVSRAAFERDGLTPETREEWLGIMKNMDISNNLIDRELLVLHNENPEMRLFVRKTLEPGVVRTPEGLKPTLNVRYEATPVSREGAVMKEARQTFESADAVAQYASENGFIASATKLMTAEYGHPKKPSIVATIRPTPEARVRAVVEERNLGALVPSNQATYSTADIQAAKKVLVKLGETYVHDDSGMTGIVEKASKEFDSVEQAEAWLRKKGITKRQRPADYVFAADFSKLPSTDQLHGLTEDQMYNIHDSLANTLRMFRIIQRRQWPDAVIEYAAEFGKTFYKRFKDAPFNKDMRLDLGIPVVSDLGPSTPSFSGTVRSKADFAPVVQDKFEQSWSQPGDAPIEGLGPTMHLSNKGGAVIPRDYTQLYTQLLDHDEPPSWPLLETAKKIDDSLKQQTAWTDAYKITEDHGASPERNQFGPRHIAVAKFRPTGQAVEIVKVPLTGDEVTVRFPGQGEVNVPRSDLQLPSAAGPIPRTPEGGAPGEVLANRQHYALADWVVSGRYFDTFKREPEIGFGKVELDLGVLGTDRPTVESAIATRAAEIANGLKITKGGMLTGSPKDISELLRIYSRSLWLDQVFETKKGVFKTGALTRAVPTIEVTKANKVSDHVVRAIESVDKSLVKPFRLAVYHTIRDQLGKTPLAELQARATSGMGLSQETENILRGWGDEMGMAKNVPLGRVVAELAERNYLNPKAQDLMVHLRKEAGFIKWAKDIGDPPADRLELKVPRVRDIWVETNLSIPWKVMRRHPLTRLVGDLIYRAQEQQFMDERVVRDLHVILRNKYHSYDDFKFLKSLKEKYNTWNDAAEGGVDTKWRFGYERLAEFFDDRRDDLIRQFLRRQVTPIAFNPDNASHRELAYDVGLDPAEVRRDALLLPKHPELVRKFSGVDVQGERPSTYWTADKIEQFMQLKANYADATKLPPEVPKEMRRVFDFWKTWGRNNYWPLVHEGNLAIKVVHEAGKPEVVGFAQTLPDAIEAVRQLRADNRISEIDMGKIHIEETRKRIADDIIQRTVPAGKFNELVATMADQMKFGPEDIQALLVRSDKPEEFIAMPKQVHAKPRIANLKPVFDDPMREVAVYSARIARMNYFWHVIEAFRLLQDGGLDGALSNAYKVQPLSELPVLNRYMKEWISRALGQRGGAERAADFAVGLANWALEGSKMSIKKLVGGDVPIPWEEIMNPKNFVRPYGARNKSSAAIAFQSLWRLGGSFGSAFANASQYWVNTIPKLIEPGENPASIATLALDSWRTSARLWRYSQFGEKGLGARLSAEELHLKDLIDRAGVSLAPSKLAIGAGRPSGLDAGIPLYKGSVPEHLYDWANYVGLFGFNGAEKTNRFGTAIAAMTKVLRKGGSDEEAISAARNLVRDTQFSYDELSIPSAMAKLGPIGRVLFQFKPFLLNQLSYEKDLMLGMFGMKPEISPMIASAQFLTHLSALGAFGGVVGLLYNPAVAIAAGAVKMATGQDIISVAGHKIPLSAKGAAELQSERRQLTATPEDNFMNSMNYQGDDLLNYGLPGMLHLSLGQRVGVSGQDVLNSFDSVGNFAGPTVSMYADMFKAWKGYLQQGTPGERARFIGGTAAGLLAGTVIGARPVLRAVSGLAGGQLASLGTHNTFREFLTGDEGRTLLLKDMQTLIRNFYRSALLHRDGALVDMDGKPQYIPASGQGEEQLYGLLGLPTIRNTEYAATESILLANADEDALQRKTMVDQIARAWADRDYEKAYEAVWRAQEADIHLPEGAIQRRVQALTNERLETLRQRVPLENRIISGEEQ